MQGVFKMLRATNELPTHSNRHGDILHFPLRRIGGMHV